MKIDRCPFTADEKNRMIAQAAYYRYEKRGRGDGDHLFSHASQNIKSWINRQHGNGK